MLWNLFDTFLVIVGSVFLVAFLIENLDRWHSRRHEYRMEQLKRQGTVTPIRKDIA